MGLLKPKLNLLTHFLLPLSPITKEQTSCLHHSAEITLINYHLHLPSSGSKNPNTFLSADLQNITWAEVNLKFHSGYEQAGRGGEGCPGHNTRGAGVPPHHAAQFCNMLPSTQPHLPPCPLSHSQPSHRCTQPLSSQTWALCWQQRGKQSRDNKGREKASCFPPVSFLVWGSIFV